jgi:predicted N-acyltransferase
MPDGGDALTLQAHESIHRIEAAAWDACAGADNPFVSHAFLATLEDSGSATAKTGWLAQHLTLTRADGVVVGCAPAYLKSHSYGEYVFDWGWAEAYQRAGGQYYPKVQVSVPFTPVPGPRLLARPGPAAAEARRLLLEGLLQMTKLHKASSLHLTFLPRDEWTLAGEAGLLRRTGLQYHWENRGYASFDDFLGALTSRKRKAIRKERAAAQASGLTIRALTGAEIRPGHWDAFHAFYLATVEKKWAHDYLTRAFFQLLGERLGERVVLVLAERDGEAVAGALNLVGGDALYGRNWGALEHHEFLHFECCYYQAIDYAIRHGLKRVEAGAQGEHKIQRGYLPVITYSAHWIADPRLERAVGDFLRRERPAVAAEAEALAAAGPYRQGGEAG